MAKVVIKKDRTVKHNGTWYKAGMTLELSDNDTKNLITDGSVEIYLNTDKIEVKPLPKKDKDTGLVPTTKVESTKKPKSKKEK